MTDDRLKQLLDATRRAIAEGAAKADAQVVPEQRRRVDARPPAPKLGDLLEQVGMRMGEQMGAERREG